MKIDVAMSKFLFAYAEAKRADWTLTNYRSILTRMAAAFPDREVESLTSDEIDNWLKSIEVSGAARQQYKLRIRPFFKWLMGRKIISSNPMDGFIMPKVEIKKIKEDQWLTFDECDRISAVSNGGLRTTFILGIKSGCRMETLTSKDVTFDLAKGELSTFEKRHREGIKYHFNGEVKATLAQYFNSGGKWPCFKSGKELNTSLAQVARRVGIKKNVTAKMLRHTFACHCRLKGMKIEDLKDQLHHANINTTMIYADIGPTQAAKTYEQFFGK